MKRLAFLLTVLISIFDIPADPSHVIIRAENEENGRVVQVKVERRALDDEQAKDAIAAFLDSQLGAR